MDDKSIDEKRVADGCIGWLVILTIFLIIVGNVYAHLFSGGC
jgi:hypothetical protein